MAEIPVKKTYLTAWDRLIAALLAFLFLCASLKWGVHALDPAYWEAMASAIGIRPPHAIFPGQWRLLVRTIYSHVGYERTLHILTWAGACTGALSVLLVHVITRDCLARLLRTENAHPLFDRLIAPFFASVCTILFGVSMPLWDVSQTLSPDGIRVFLFLLAIALFLRMLVCGGLWRLYTLVFIVAVLASESIFAFLLIPLLVVWYVRHWRTMGESGSRPPKHLPPPDDAFPYWRVFLFFIIVFGGAIWANVSSFISLGGPAANGWSTAGIYFRYVAGYFIDFIHVASLLGWMLGLGLAVLPLVVALHLFPIFTRDDRPVLFRFGIAFFLVMVVAVLQTGAFPTLRFWTFTNDEVVIGSRAMLTFFAFTSALTVVLAGAGFTFECQRYCRLCESAKLRFAVRVLVPVLTLALVVAAICPVPRLRTNLRVAQTVIDDAIAETLRECGDAKWLITDGLLDPGLELAACARGKRLMPLSLMSGDSDWEKTIRTRAIPAGPDRELAEQGIPILLRVWAGEKEHGMDDAAIQLGFEFWKRARKPLPRQSGLVARTSGLSAEEAARGIAAAQALALRVASVSEEVEKMDVTPALTRALSAISWRLSRFARLRDEGDLAERLDATNGIIKKMLSVIEYERRRTFMQLTPREGLEIALRRADFVEARRYATAVLRITPEDAEANFGLGMSFLKSGNLKEAERYLRKVLVTRPEEPAVLNNLSIICRKYKRYDEAVALAKRALKVLPESKEVRQTLSDAEAKRP